jgi:AraC-like DNA-binding protein
MDASPNGATSFHFSTDAFPERQRLAAWQEVFGRTVCNLDIEPFDVDSFHSEATVCQMPGLGVLFGTGSVRLFRHTRELIKDGDLSFLAAPSCSYAATQLGRRIECRAGDGVLFTNAEVARVELAAASRFTTFRVPAAAIEPLVGDVSAAVARIVPASTVALLLLVRYLKSAVDTDALATPGLQQIAVTHVYDLLALALGATRDGAEIAKGRGLRVARLTAIKADILAHLGAGDLSLDAVAKRQGISPIYVRKLFEGEDTSFTLFVLDQRLARAHRLLSDPRLADRSIGELAIQAGFNDLSYFNRAFRRRYGATPSDVRAQTRGETQGRTTRRTGLAIQNMD